MTTSLAHLCERVTSFIHRSCDEKFLHSDDNHPAFDDLASEIFHFQFGHNYAYRRLCEAAGAHSDLVSSRRKIPAVPAAAFKEMDLTCLAPDERTAVFHSSGTTGQQPSRHFHSQETLAVYEASLLPWFRRHVLPGEEAADRSLALFSLTPTAKIAPHSSLAHMIGAVTQKFGGHGSRSFGIVDDEGRWSIDVDALLAALTATSQPVLLLGTAFNFVHLLEAMEARGLQFQLPPRSRVMETGGYKGRSRELPKAVLHAGLTQRLGLPASAIVCEYGMSELSSQAYDRSFAMREPSSPPARLFRFPPWCRFQIIDPETARPRPEGSPGLLRILDLANVASVIAVQTEDLAVQHGDGFELLGRAAKAEPRGCSLMTV